MVFDSIIEEILRSKKYKDIPRSVIEHLCVEGAKRFKKEKDISKYVRKELHIIYESFLQKDCYRIANELLDDNSGKPILGNKQLSVELMQLHTSTKERLPFATEIYSYIGNWFSGEDSVTDLGCGFNPFALSFYEHIPLSYHAFDLSLEMIMIIRRFFSLTQMVTYTAEVLDISKHSPSDSTDILIMLKVLPLLNQQQPGRSVELLQSFNYKKAIISFPTSSLSGRNKGMTAFYSSYFENTFANFSLLDKSILGNELFYVIEK